LKMSNIWHSRLHLKGRKTAVNPSVLVDLKCYTLGNPLMVESTKLFSFSSAGNGLMVLQYLVKLGAHLKIFR